jgi:pilus assembly protein CpaE
LAQSSLPYVTVNSEDILHAEQIHALASSDHIVLTMRLDLVSVYRAQQHLTYLRQNHVPVDRICLVAMSTGGSAELPRNSVAKVLGGAEVHYLPDDPESSMAGINIGNPVVLEAPRSKLSQAIEHFSDSFLGLTESSMQETKRLSTSRLRAAAVLTLSALSFCK